MTTDMKKAGKKLKEKAKGAKAPRTGPLTPDEMAELDMAGNSMAYMDPKHPDHEKMKALMMAGYGRGYKRAR